MSRPSHAGAAASSSSILAIPTPIKQLFDRFPLLAYPINDLPQRAPRPREGEGHGHVLYVFTTDQAARRGAPSYNPTCLKWQAYLNFSRIPFRTAPANNHAAPSGALPFLLPSLPESHKDKDAQAVTAGKLQSWAMKQSPRAVEEPRDWRYEAYLSLVNHNLRRAWLYSLYLSPNAVSIAEPLYILPTSSNPFVRLALARQLQQAAKEELFNFPSTIHPGTLYTQAEDALVALDVLLGSNDWFFASSNPTLFDASVFAYTHLLLDSRLGKSWVDSRLCNALMSRNRLITHRDRILSEYFPDAS